MSNQQTDIQLTKLVKLFEDKDSIIISTIAQLYETKNLFCSWQFYFVICKKQVLQLLTLFFLSPR